MIDLRQCTGCSACAMTCPTHAISMQTDGEGFLYPIVNEAQCIHCNQCVSVCPLNQDAVSEQEKCFWVTSDCDELCRQSSSGGAFSMLAEQVLSEGGMVFGCAMTDDCYSAHHIGVETKEWLSALRGSKYVQSVQENSFAAVKYALEQGKKVLFSGTPCQNAGLRSFLGNANTKNLFLVDVICHGVPSPMVWKQYLLELEHQYQAKVIRVSFRNKAEGWRKYSLECVFDNGEIYRKNVIEDLYLRGFVENLYLRPSCYNCVFKGKRYASDLTIGDFWGIEEVDGTRKGSLGISLLITHSEKAQEMIRALNACTLETVSTEEALRHNPSYYQSASPNPFRDRAMREINVRGTRKTLRKYCGFGMVARVRKKLVILIRKIRETDCKK